MLYEKLKKEVEEQLHRKLNTHGDFEYLSQQIQKRCHETLSTSTLMRLWGQRASVSARQSTLDILAHFIGYEDYTHFMAERGNAEEDASEKEVTETLPANSPTPKRRGRWIAGVVALIVLVAAGGAFWHLNHSQDHLQEAKKPVLITEVEKLRNDRQYYIHTRDDLRGILGINGKLLCTTFKQAQPGRKCDKPSPYAMIRYEDSYYLYSVATQRFINVGLVATDKPMSQRTERDNGCALALHNEEGGIVIDFKCCNTPCSLNANSSYGVLVTTWGTINGYYDEGNLFSFEDIGPFDPTEALDMIEKDKKRIM